MEKKRLLTYVFLLSVLSLSGIILIFFRPVTLGGDTMYEPVLTGSMEPAIPVGGVVMIKPVNPDSIKIGDVICFNFSDSTLITHRVDSINQDGFVTKGDANEDIDLKLVKSEDVVGKVIFTLPIIGYIGTFARSQIGLFLFLFVPASVIMIYEIKNIVTEIKPTDDHTNLAKQNHDD